MPIINQNFNIATKYMNSFSLLTECYYSAFELECYMSDKYWTDVMCELWPKFMSTKRLEFDYHPCQFRPMFGTNYSAPIYSNLWSQVRQLFEFT